MALNEQELGLLRSVLNAWPDDSTRINLHRVLNREAKVASPPVKVLDHGYIKIIDSMGTDETIVEAARLSTGRGFVSWDPYVRCKSCDTPFFKNAKGDYNIVPGYEDSSPSTCYHGAGPVDVIDFPRGDIGVLDYLYSHQHKTPFEMCELVIEVQAPILVFREWHRHRTQQFNEFSARYAVMPDLHYVPAIERIQKQSKHNKQGSSESMDPGYAEQVTIDLTQQQKLVYSSYNNMLEHGVAREVARINTPVSRYSKMRAKGNLRNWFGFLMLRCDETAQLEIRQFADVVAKIIKQLWPRPYGLFLEYDFLATQLSRTETRLMQTMIAKLLACADEEARGTISKIMGEVQTELKIDSKKFSAFKTKLTDSREDRYQHLL